MPYTLYEGFVLQTKRALTALSNILHKAEEHPQAGIFPTSRLYDDMKSFSYQVWAATTQTLMVLARLTDQEMPVVDPYQDVTLSYAEMFEHIDNALKALDAADRDYIVANCETVKPTAFGGGKPQMSGTNFAYIMEANIFFHVTTAYGILRKEGVPLGKADYLLPFIQM